MSTPFDPVIFDSYIFDADVLIKYGTGIRFGAGWKWGGLSQSNPLEYFPFSRVLTADVTITTTPETAAAITVVADTASSPTYTKE